tara:strand:+ start:10 stop:861 length:852 start_codon:yes stop_codon:yes gene_type:complete
MAYTQNNPFSRKSVSPLKSLDSSAYTSYADKFDEKTGALLDDARQSTIDFAGYRGRDTYGKVTDSARGIMSPYVKSAGTDKKYPYLSSKHHAGVNIHNPMQSDRRRENYLTIEEERKAEQDRLLSGSFVNERQGTRGSSYYGPEFNKTAEKAAQNAVKRHEYLLNAASQGEEALNAALSTAKQPNKKGVLVTSEMPVREKYPISSQDTGAAINLDGGYAANPSGQSLRNIHTFTDLRDRASSAQDVADTMRQMRERMRYFDSSEGLNERSGKNYFNARSGNKY